MNEPTLQMPQTPPNEPAGSVPAAPPVVPVGGRRLSILGWSGLSSLGLLVLLVLGNAVLARTSQRVDLTEEKLWTLSDATRKIVARLPEKVTVRVFWSEEIPDAVAPLKRRIGGLLEEYEHASGGRVVVDWVDMSGTEGPAEAERRGLQKYEWAATVGKRHEAAEGFLGLAILYEDKTEKIDRLNELEDRVEYEITSRIFQLSRDRPPVVGLVQEMPPMNFMGQRGGGDMRFSLLSTLLEKIYRDGAKTWLSLDDTVPADVSVLVVAAPKNFDDKKVYHLEQFLLRGGKALVLLNAVQPEQGSLRASSASKSGLEDWLKGYGVDVPDGIVGDFEVPAEGVWYPARLRGRGALAPFPYWPFVIGESIDRTNPATARFDPKIQIPLYFPSEVSADPKAQEQAGRRATILVSTTEAGYRLDDASRLYDEEGPLRKDLAKHSLAVILEGKFESKWKGKTAPDAKPPETPPAMEGEPAMGEPGMDEPAMDEPAMDGDAGMATEPAMGDAPPPAMGESPPTPPAMGESPPTPPAMGESPPTPPAMGESPPTPPSMDEPPKDEPPMEGPKGPRGPDGDDGPPALPPSDGKETAKKDDPKTPKLEEGSGVLVVLGDADLAADDFSGYRGYDRSGVLASMNGNAGFPLVMNLIDWMTGSEDLIALRSRGAKARHLDEVEDGTISAIEWANHLGVPLLVLLSGLVVFIVRRQRR